MFLRYFFRILPLTSYFYLVYSLSFAFMASCGSDFHSVAELCEKAWLLYFKPSVKCWGVRNS